MTKTIPLDAPLHLRPVKNDGWVISVGEDPRVHPEMFAFTSAADMMKALSEAFHPIVPVSASMPGVPLDETPKSLGERLEAAPREPGRFLLDLHLEPGDIVVAVTDDFPMRVYRGSTYRVKSHLFRGSIIELPTAIVDRNYRGARFEVCHRHPKSEAL